MKKYFYVYILLFISVSLVSANPNSINTKYGIYGGINMNSHNADFYKLRSIPNCCPNFELGNGIGNNRGLLFEYKLNNLFWIGSKFGIMELDGVFKKEEATTIMFESGPAEGKYEHKMTSIFTNVSFEPSIIFNPFAALYFSAGARIGKNLIMDYEEVETITEPDSYATFIDPFGNDTHSRTRNKYSGEIYDAISFQMSLLGSISYELPMNSEGSLLLVPEVSYYYPITELVANTNWKVSSISVGISLKFVPIPKPPKEEIFRDEYLIDTIKIESDKIADNTFVFGLERIITTTDETDTEIITTTTLIRTDTLFYKKIYEHKNKVKTSSYCGNPDIQICNQIWSGCNLDVEYYRNGDPIRYCETYDEWLDAASKHEGAWCYYDNDPENGAIYGKLYNWYAVNDPRGLAPEGWHVPTDEEWKELEMCLGMSQFQEDKRGFSRGTVEGSQLAGRSNLWLDGVLENNAYFGSTGFSALPGNYRNYRGVFFSIGYNGFWWTASKYDDTYAWLRFIQYNKIGIGRSNQYGKSLGCSVRLVRD